MTSDFFDQACEILRQAPDTEYVLIATPPNAAFRAGPVAKMFESLKVSPNYSTGFIYSLLSLVSTLAKSSDISFDDLQRILREEFSEATEMELRSECPHCGHVSPTTKDATKIVCPKCGLTEEQ